MLGKNYSNNLRHIPWYYLTLLLIVNCCIHLSCTRFKNNSSVQSYGPSSPDSIISWNVLFKPGTDKANRDNIIDNIGKAIKDYYNGLNANGTTYTPKFFPPVFCPCDTLLYNLDFYPVDGTGKSVTTPPPSKPGPAGSGDYANVVAITDNIPINNEPLGEIDFSQYGKDSVVVKNIVSDSAKKIAIIDSGIDSSLFTKDIKNVIWTDPFSSTLFNFLPRQSLKDLFDGTREKHGSAVAAIIIKAMDDVTRYPKLMILKALDNNKRGSIFSVSCALSYAIQKRADIINLSLGYYGEPDAVLNHYLGLSVSPEKTIEIFTAAGNTPGNHNATNICNSTFNNNLLSLNRKFYPACSVNEFNNMTSVTQLSKPDVACFYQNYSNEFITLGVYDKTNCCAVKVDFLSQIPNYYEGSSFATPIASGLKMGTLLKMGNAGNVNTAWNSLLNVEPGKKVIVQGKYITYSSNR